MKSKTFSAMVCLYERTKVGELIAALDHAIVQQSYPPSELIVVFDGPVPEEVIDAIETYATRIKIVKIEFKENMGHGRARAAAIEACNTDWIAIIDSDDISMEYRFEALFNIAYENPNCAVVGGGIREFCDDGTKRIMLKERFFPKTPEDNLKFLKFRSPVAQATAILNVQAVKNVGNYQHWLCNEDYYLWLRLVAAGYEIRNVERLVLLFRVSNSLYERRGGYEYWVNEVKLQLFSFRQGTTNLIYFFMGSALRFFVQVILPQRFRRYFYQIFLR